MVSRENKVVGACVVVAMVLTYGGFWLAGLSSEILMGVLIFVGVVAPMVVNNYFDNRESV
ncbi:hypothetical protein SAMN05444422_101380 [Halobiforma haloterrestris]|uniref:Uncharacterized protein n=1 Tax=Natronobacterium haloterrestre TaxID=148448 RepID=A0A1I1D7W4_NATHA|nr:hypothetical protein [Halobiforma haloterrestris]SFB71015.1 hypothetical protein SAMN05444422_101380 [Halobiforma haloterrestris]